MAGFLRKKTRNKQPNREPVASLPSAPIFAKLATSLTRNAARPASPTFTVVSHPMALGSGGPHPAAPLGPSSGAAVANRQLPKHHGTQRTGAPADSQKAQFSSTPSQQSKTFRRVSADKPLPVPVPTYDDPSPDSSAPAVPGTPLQATPPAHPLPLTPSQRAHPPHASISPPSAYDPKVQRDQRRVSVDLHQKVVASGSFDQQRLANMAPPDNGVVGRHSRSHSHRLNMRRLTNDIQSLPIRHQNEGGTTVPVLGSPSSPLLSKNMVGQPAQVGNQPTSLERMDNSVMMLRAAATVNELTPSASALRDGEAMLESKLDIYGDSATSTGQTNSHHRTNAAHPNGRDFGNPNDMATRRDSILDRPLPSQPVTIEQRSANDDDNNGGGDDIHVDATGEISQTPPALGAEELSPEFILYRDFCIKSIPSPANSLEHNQSSLTAENRLPLQVSQTSTLQNYEDFTVASDSNNMGVAVSFPDAQDSSPMSKYEPRAKRLPSPPTEGEKLRNGHLTRDHYQPFNPYQELSQAPQFTSRVRGKPLIFAAMEANIDQQQPGEEQTFSVRVWDGQDHTLGQHLGGYKVSPPPPPEQKRAVPAEGASRNAAASYPSPPPSEFPLPRAGKSEGHREPLQTTPSTVITPTKSRKLSKARHSTDMRRPATPVRARPLTPVSPAPPAKRPAVAANIPGPSIQSPTTGIDGQELQAALPSRHVTRCSGMSLLGVDDVDPFAKTECVKVMAPPHSTVQEKELREKEKIQEREKESKRETKHAEEGSQGRFEDGSVQLKKQPSDRIDGDGEPLADNVKVDIKSGHIFHRDEERISRTSGLEEWESKSDVDVRPASPVSLEDRPQDHLERDIDPIVAFHLPSHRRKGKQSSFQLAEFISRARLLSELLTYLSFYDWCILSSVSKQIRTTLGDNEGLREIVLERFLRTVGYVKWCWDGADPLPLSLQDLGDYMYGVSTPNHEYARVADLYVKSLTLPPAQRDPALYDTVGRLTGATRAYSRIVLRLRAQAEKDAASRAVIPVSGRNGCSRPPSRASSPTQSTFSHSHSHPPLTQGSTGFRSPLFRPKRAPLLRVFVPSPDGDWLSDKSVLECEEECRRADILGLMRFGDVVWDTAVGDEGNVGKLIWDGSYLIDLDYSYSPVGDLPKYVPALAFPPSYFHKVIRTGSNSSNPIVHIDISPWGEEIATNLQLLQDRVRTETPQGAFHNVVRWVNRSSFVIRPSSNSPRTRGSIQGGGSPRVPIPDTHGLFVDPGWCGTIIVETEGTKESLADLQDRCGPGVFPPRAKGVTDQMGINVAADARKVFRVIRERSRPGEIWIKAVSIKERLL